MSNLHMCFFCWLVLIFPRIFAHAVTNISGIVPISGSTSDTVQSDSIDDISFGGIFVLENNGTVVNVTLPNEAPTGVSQLQKLPGTEKRDGLTLRSRYLQQRALGFTNIALPALGGHMLVIVGQQLAANLMREILEHFQDEVDQYILDRLDDNVDHLVEHAISFIVRSRTLHKAWHMVFRPTSRGELTWETVDEVLLRFTQNLVQGGVGHLVPQFQIFDSVGDLIGFGEISPGDNPFGTNHLLGNGGG